MGNNISIAYLLVIIISSNVMKNFEAICRVKVMAASTGNGHTLLVLSVAMQMKSNQLYPNEVWKRELIRTEHFITHTHTHFSF